LAFLYVAFTARLLDFLSKKHIRFRIALVFLRSFHVAIFIVTLQLL